MAYLNFSYDLLKDFCMEAFEKFGFSDSESTIITDVLLLSDLYGIESHGMNRLVRYHKGIASGMIKLDTKPEIVFETPVSAVIDGHDGMGQLLSHYAMNLAIEKAKQTGIAIVTVKNSNHFGIAGYYAKMACDAGLFGFATTNSESIMVPTNAKVAILGTNPLAFAMPADPYPFFFDASTTTVTRGKVEMYNKMKKPLPEGWSVDENGNACSDAERVLANIIGKKGGGNLPLGGLSELTGGHKGYGYGMISEFFSAIISQGMTSDKTQIGTFSGTCHGFGAINPAIFGDPDAIKTHFSKFLQELRDAPKADGKDRIYTHGEKDVESFADKMKNGIPVNEVTILEMIDMCNFLKIDSKKYFGDFTPSDPSLKVTSFY